MSNDENNDADKIDRQTTNQPSLDEQMDAFLGDPTKKAPLLLKMGLEGADTSKGKIKPNKRTRTRATTLPLVGSLEVVGLTCHIGRLTCTRRRLFRVTRAPPPPRNHTRVWVRIKHTVQPLTLQTSQDHQVHAILG